MYLANAPERSSEGLGFVTAVMAAASLKSLFGFGKKKAALKQIDANAAGKWTSQFPPYADWAEYVNRPRPADPKKKCTGASMAADYECWRKRKDSILIKHQIATPEDYGAWLVATYGVKDGWINPNSKPGDAVYNNGPFAIGTRIPIFDYDAIVKWAASQTPVPPASLPPAPLPMAPTLAPPIPMTAPPSPSAMPPAASAFTPGAMPAVNFAPQASGFFPASSQSAPAYDAAPAADISAPGHMDLKTPLAVAAVLALVLLASGKGRKK